MGDASEGPIGPIMDELLCFVVNKMDILDADSIVRLCMKTYT